ncbi:predicted protein [Lichtheimia corymbifera JMRC:FSU:9682]|uniref:J domain-containing protein n=1 Tax=Lichtheimia corymbifera JMRC:FSU:9682 TaxID=1263082 RepID=A0A068RWL3_9FUNG|nr:predicted protein [Lichtheimia corymbifera JMRC:FSU:9682]
MRAVVSAELMRFYPIVRETGHKHARHCVTYTEILIHAAEKRRVYDNQASAPPPPQSKPASENRWPRQEQQPFYDPFAGFHFHTPEEIFAQFFNGRDPFAAMMMGDPLSLSLDTDPFFERPSIFFEHHQPRTYASYNTDYRRRMGNSGSKSSSQVTTTSRYINGKYGSVVVKTIRDNQGTRVIEDYGNGRRRVVVNGVETENTLTPQQEQHNPVKLMTLDTSTPDEAPPSSRMPQEPRREPYVKPSRSAARPMLLDEISDHNNRYGPRQGDQEPSNVRRHMIRPPVSMSTAPTQQPTGGALDTLKRLFCFCCP